MTITAQVIADSISREGVRITTLQLRYPRFIHSELMTHKDFSRNASSSRAIPVARMIEDLKRDPAMPVFWGSNKPGMQAGAELDQDDLEQCRAWWLEAMRVSIRNAEMLMKNGLHKQIANRILEPWAHMNTIVTATRFNNFFALRIHPDAQPEIKVLAEAMKAAIDASAPKQLAPGEWHLPYIKDYDWAMAQQLLMKDRITRDAPQYAEIVEKVLKLVSVARCARVSYLTHDGRETSVEEDFALANRLIGSTPLHASPAEHQATPDEKGLHDVPTGMSDGWFHPELHGNLHGWIQYRKQLAGEYVD